MTSPPTVEQASRMVDLGWTICCVYVGGPRAAAGDQWQQGVVGYLNDIFEGFVPITVVRNAPWDSVEDIGGDAEQDAQRAASDMGACGFGPDRPLVVDLEYGTWQRSPST